MVASEDRARWRTRLPVLLLALGVSACVPDTGVGVLEQNACLFPLGLGVCGPPLPRQNSDPTLFPSVGPVLETCYLAEGGPELNRPYGDGWRRAPEGVPGPCTVDQTHLQVDPGVGQGGSGALTLVCSSALLRSCPEQAPRRTQLVCQPAGTPLELGRGLTAASLASDGQRLLAIWRGQGITLPWQLLDADLDVLEGSVSGAIEEDSGFLDCSRSSQLSWSPPWLREGLGEVFASRDCTVTNLDTDAPVQQLFRLREGRVINSNYVCGHREVVALPRGQEPALLASTLAADPIPGPFIDELGDANRFCHDNLALSAVHPPDRERVAWLEALTLPERTTSTGAPDLDQDRRSAILVLTETDARGIELSISILRDLSGGPSSTVTRPLLTLPSPLSDVLRSHPPAVAVGRKHAVVVVASPPTGIIGSEIQLADGTIRNFTFVPMKGQEPASATDGVDPGPPRRIALAVREEPGGNRPVGVCYVARSGPTWLLAGDGSPLGAQAAVSARSRPCAVVPAPPGPATERFHALVAEGNLVRLVSDTETSTRLLRTTDNRLLVPVEPAELRDIQAVRLRGRLLVLLQGPGSLRVYEVTTAIVDPPCDAAGACPDPLLCRGGICVDSECDPENGVRECTSGRQCVAGGCITRTASATPLWERPTAIGEVRPRLSVVEAADPADDIAEVQLLEGTEGRPVLVHVDLRDGKERTTPVPEGASDVVATGPVAGETAVLAYSGLYRNEQNPEQRSAWHILFADGVAGAPRRLVPAVEVIAALPRLVEAAGEQVLMAYQELRPDRTDVVWLSELAGASDRRSRLVWVAEQRAVDGLAVAPLESADPTGPQHATVAFTSTEGESAPRGAALSTVLLGNGPLGPAVEVPIDLPEPVTAAWTAPELTPLGPGVTLLSVTHRERLGAGRALVPVDALGQRLGPALLLGAQRSAPELPPPPATVIRHGQRIFFSWLDGDRVLLDEITCQER